MRLLIEVTGVTGIIIKLGFFGYSRPVQRKLAILTETFYFLLQSKAYKRYVQDEIVLYFSYLRGCFVHIATIRSSAQSHPAAISSQAFPAYG